MPKGLCGSRKIKIRLKEASVEQTLYEIEAEGFDSILLDDDWIVFDPARVKVVGTEER